MKRIITTALAIVMLVSVFAFAVSAATSFPSPGEKDYFTVVAKVKDDKGGTAKADPATVEDGETSKITAKADAGYKFDGWTFTGEFDWIEGDANSETIVIRPKSDVVFVATFEGEGGPGKDPDQQSPVTGYDLSATLAVMAVVLVASAAVVVYTGKRYYSNAK